VHIKSVKSLYGVIIEAIFISQTSQAAMQVIRESEISKTKEDSYESIGLRNAKGESQKQYKT